MDNNQKKIIQILMHLFIMVLQFDLYLHHNNHISSMLHDNLII